MTKFLPLLLLTPALLAAQAPPRPGLRRPMPEENLYVPAKETTLRGFVRDVKITPLGLGARAYSITVEDAKKAVTLVHVGPERFVQAKGFTFAMGDEVTILGAPAEWAEETFLLARSITKEGKTLALRDERGEPLWPRGGRRRR